MRDIFRTLHVRNIIGTVARSTVIAQYLVFCEDNGFQPLSRATIYRVLKVREASQRKSLQGLDNVSADGAESFQKITRSVEELEEEYGVSKDWCSDVRNRLKMAKCYLNIEYRVHCRDEKAVVQITVGSSLLVILLMKTSNTIACTTIYQSEIVARN